MSTFDLNATLESIEQSCKVARDAESSAFDQVGDALRDAGKDLNAWFDHDRAENPKLTLNSWYDANADVIAERTKLGKTRVVTVVMVFGRQTNQRAWVKLRNDYRKVGVSTDLTATDEPKLTQEAFAKAVKAVNDYNAQADDDDTPCRWDRETGVLTPTGQGRKTGSPKKSKSKAKPVTTEAVAEAVTKQVKKLKPKKRTKRTKEIRSALANMDVAFDVSKLDIDETKALMQACALHLEELELAAVS